MSSTGTAARRSTRTARALTVLAATAAAVALWVVAAPIGGADLTVQQGDQEPRAHVTLVLMHIVVGALLIACLRRTATDRRPA